MVWPLSQSSDVLHTSFEEIVSISPEQREIQLFCKGSTADVILLKEDSKKGTELTNICLPNQPLASMTAT